MKRSEIIRKLMEEKEMKVSDISKHSGIAYSTIKSILENGTEKASYINICKICDAIGITSDQLEILTKNGEPNKSDISKADLELIKTYHSLDDFGKEHIDYELARELERIAQLSKREDRINELESKTTSIIDFDSYKNPSDRLVEYHKSASAGDGVFILGNEAPAKIAVSESDWNELADYAISISGTSMEPDYNDGDTVLVSQRVQIRYGDVGIFVVDGKAYIKEYGEKELISRNPDAENIKISEFANIVCMGKVVGKINGEFRIISD